MRTKSPKGGEQMRVRWTQDHTAIAVLLAFQQAAHELGRRLADPVNDNEGAKLVFEILDRWNIPVPASLLRLFKQHAQPGNMQSPHENQ